MKPARSSQPLPWCRIGVAVVLALISVVAVLLGFRFLQDEPVRYDDPVEHFKYGSTIWAFPTGYGGSCPKSAATIYRATVSRRSGLSTNPATICRSACRGAGTWAWTGYF